jgi:hypothetical protein
MVFIALTSILKKIGKAREIWVSEGFGWVSALITIPERPACLFLNRLALPHYSPADGAHG